MPDKPLSDFTDAELREQIQEALSHQLMDFLQAAKETHMARVVLEGINIVHIHALGDPLEEVTERLQSASENHRRVLAAWELLVARQREKDKKRRSRMSME